MECNKEEAIRAKEIAEKKLMEKDFTGAKKIALKAQKLNPDIDNLPQLLTIIDVYIAAEKRVTGQLDFYKILGVDFLDETEEIWKHCNELVKKIYSGKNKSVGTDGALKLISEAWNVLSDEDDRYDYDQKRNVKSDTFFTRCPDCKKVYEHPRSCVNRYIYCHSCRQGFMGDELRPIYVPPGQQPVKEAEAIYEEALRMLNMGGVVPYDNAPNGKSSMPPAPSSHHPASTSNNVANGTAAGSSASAGVGQSACEQLKRGLEEAPPATRNEALRKKTTGAGFATGSSNAGSSSVPEGDI